jgi:hypothetical protein
MHVFGTCDHKLRFSPSSVLASLLPAFRTLRSSGPKYYNNYSALSRQSPLTQLVNQTLSAIKENVFVYRAHFSINASARASDPNKDFFFNFAPQWVTEEKN